jgi:hypothetical protein
MISKETRAYFAEIGRVGGKKSRRSLSREQAQMMVAVRMARSAYRKFSTRCFWSFSRDLPITAKNAAWVVQQLRRNGDRTAWLTAARIQALLPLPTGSEDPMAMTGSNA